MAWARISSTVPKEVVKVALESLADSPRHDPQVEQLRKMRKTAQMFGRGSADTEALSLIDQAINATQRMSDKAGNATPN